MAQGNSGNAVNHVQRQYYLVDRAQGSQKIQSFEDVICTCPLGDSPSHSSRTLSPACSLHYTLVSSIGRATNEMQACPLTVTLIIIILFLELTILDAPKGVTVSNVAGTTLHTLEPGYSIPFCSTGK